MSQCGEGTLTQWLATQIAPGALPHGTALHRGRNLLLLQQAPDGAAVVCKYFGRTVAGLFSDPWRGSKARRSYAIALELRRRGIATPTPLAWAEHHRGGLVLASAYACASLAGARQLHHWLRGAANGWEGALYSAGQAIAAADAAGVHHRDLSPGNLVWGAEAGLSPAWHLVDLNRVRFGAVPAASTGAARLDRLASVEPGPMLALLRGYAAGRGADPADILQAWLRARQHWLSASRLQRRSRPLRRELARRFRC